MTTTNASTDKTASLIMIGKVVKRCNLTLYTGSSVTDWLVGWSAYWLTDWVNGLTT